MSQQKYRQTTVRRRRKLPAILSEPDNVLIIIISFLVIVGIMAIFSATAQKAIDENSNPASYVIKQIICLVVGIFVMKGFINFDYKKLANIAIPFPGL